VPEDYVHRIGRTGRAGSSGEALSLVSPDEMKYLSDIEKLTKKQIARIAPPAFELPPASADDTAREPRQPRQGARREGGRSEGGRNTASPRREGQRDGAPRAGGQPRARSEGGRAPRTAGTVVSSSDAAPAARAPRADGQPARQPRNRNDNPRSNAAGRTRSDAQPGSQPRPRGAGNGAAVNTGNGPRRQGASQPARTGSGGGNRPSNNRPRYPHDENGDVNGNVIIAQRTDEEVNGNRPGASEGGFRNALSRGIKALRRMT
jgi:superfamily II DNA/RNA helicase